MDEGLGFLLRMPDHLLCFLQGVAGSSIFDTDDLNVKNQNCTWGDVLASLGVSVSKFGWNKEFPFVTFNHQLHSFSPAFNHLIRGECARFSALVATVKNCSVNQSTFIMALTSFVHFWVYGSFTFIHNSILQSTG
eukprot:TRINITY_DN14_c0_g1_i2.p1 TRINITY_DN14_c0_g1~~TRINITY_DN14_c0_g1_i2.p1  ORF type:complete len:135 (-),score=3.93 TRINITY_DN14_c0_g1_i2:115-519(-)